MLKCKRNGGILFNIVSGSFLTLQYVVDVRKDSVH
jgi:hypothetical protein